MPTFMNLFVLLPFWVVFTHSNEISTQQIELSSILSMHRYDNSQRVIRLENKQYGCASQHFESVQLTLKGETGTSISKSTIWQPNKERPISREVSRNMKNQNCLFDIVNSTLSFDTLLFDMESFEQTNPNVDHDISPTLSSLSRCAIVEASCVSFSSCVLRLGQLTSPILIQQTANLATEASVTFVGCEMCSSSEAIPAFAEILDRKGASQPTHSFVTISSCSFSSSAILSKTGIAAETTTPSPFSCLSTSIVSCSFVNVSSCEQPAFRQPRLRLTQMLVGTELNRVENGLYGTVSASLSSSAEFRLRNSTLLECENCGIVGNADDPTIKHITDSPTLTSATGAFVYDAEFTHYHFSDNTITSKTQTKQFTIVNINPLAGCVRFTRTTFNVNCTNKHVYLMDLRGNLDSHPRLVIDSSKVSYDKASTLTDPMNQIITYYSVTTDISNSEFNSIDGASRTRTFQAASSVPFIQVSNSKFSAQTISASGAVFYSSSTSNYVLRVFDSLFENNEAGTTGGCVYTYYADHAFHRCIFRKNTAATRGGALYFNQPNLLFFEDTHFDDNQAMEYLENIEEYAHYRGNDIHFSATSSNALPASKAIGCTSTTKSNKFGYFYSVQYNGDVSYQNTMLPTPSTTIIPTLFVETAGTGTDCAEATPCPTITSALTEVTAGFTRINVGMGTHSHSSETITKSVQLLGRGWMTNTTAFTIVEMGGVSVGNNGNLTLTSLSLKPSTKSSIILTHSSSSASTFVVNVWIDGISDHTTHLFSFSSGKATFHLSRFNAISLTATAAISVTGTASLEMNEVWFSHVKTSSTTGGSCLDAQTSSSISIVTSDAAYCSSSGPAGAFHFTRMNNNVLTLTNLLFTSNKASTTLPSIGNDIVLVGFPSNFLNVTSSVKSISEKPRCLIDNTVVNFQIPNCGYSQYGIDHPMNHRFYLGLKISQFVSLANTIQELAAPGTQPDLRIQNVDPINITQTTFHDREILIRLPKIQQTSNDVNAFFTFSDSATIRFRQGSITIPSGTLTTPFKVVSSSALFQIADTTIYFPPTVNYPLVHNINGKIYFEGAYIRSAVSFVGCSLVHSFGGYFQATHWSYFELHSDSNGSFINAKNTSIVLCRVEFKNCSSKNGGVAYVEFQDSHYFKAYVLQYPDMFKNCSATETDENGVLIGRGGALYFCGTTTSARPIILNTDSLNHARFEGNKAAQGNDIFVESSLFSGKEVKDIPTFGGISMSDEFRVEIADRQSTEEKEAIHFFLPTPTISVNGSVKLPLGGTSGTDGDDCKWTGTHCATLKYGVRHLKQKFKDGTHFPQSITFVWNMTYTEKDVVIEDQDITVKGTKTTNEAKADVLRSIVDVDASMNEGGFLFTIKDNASLVVSNLDIRPIVKCGLFDVKEDGRSLELNDVAVICSTAEEYGHPLIRSTLKPIRIVKSTFNTTKGSSGCATFSAPLVSFSSPTSSFFITSTTFSSLQATSSALMEIDTDGEISVLSTSFSDCSSSPERNGELIFVRTSDPSSAISGERWEGSFTAQTSPNSFYVETRDLDSSDEWLSLPLLLFLISPSERVFLDSIAHSTTHTNCGSTSLACSSLASAVASAKTHSIGEISLRVNAEVSTLLSFSSSITVHPHSDSPLDITLKSAAQIEQSSSLSTLSFANLHFSIDSSCSASPLFVVLSGTLHLSSCQIGGDSETVLPSSLATVVEVSGAGSLTLTSTTFRNLKFTHASGSTIHLDSKTSFSANTGSIFEGISSTGVGSLVFVKSEDLSKTSALAPFALLKKTIVVPQDGQFSQVEKNKFVGQVGTLGPESLLFFWFAHTEQETSLFIDSDGEDHVHCGLSLLPCETLDRGLLNVKKTGTDVMLGSSSSLTSSLKTRFASHTIISKSEQKTITVDPLGSLSVLEDHELNLNTLLFVFESGDRSSVFISVASGSLSIDSCSFGSSSTESTLDKGFLDVCGSLSLVSTSFTKVRSSSPKGIVSVDLSGSHTLSTSATTFTSCSSSSPLFSLTLSTSTEQTNWDFNLSGLSFTSPSNGIPSGTQLFVSGPSFDTQIVPARFPAVTAETDPKLFWGSDTSNGIESSLLVYLIEAGSEIEIDGTNGRDISKCGHFGVSCVTIGKGISRATAANSAKQITILDATSLNETINPGTISLCIAGKTTKQTLIVECDGQFVVSDGSLSLKLLGFTTSVSPFSRSLISVSLSGSLSINSCSFSSFSSSTSPSILTASIESGKTLSIVDTTFESCNSVGSCRSGVVDVSLAEGSTLTFSASSNPFTSCSSESANANHLFLSHPSLSKEVIATSLLFDWDQSAATSRDCVGKEGDHAIPVPLSLYILPLTSETFIDSESCDVSVCGFSEYPCASLTSLHSRIADTASTSVTLRSCLTHSSDLSFSNDISFVGGNNTMTIVESSQTPVSRSLFTFEGKTVFTELSFLVPGDFKHSNLHHCRSGSLTVKNCSFRQTTPSAISTILIEVNTGASLCISQTFFECITSFNEKAGVISVSLKESARLVLDNNTFTSCSSRGAHSIFIKLENTTDTEVVSDTFDYSLTNLVFSSPSSNSESDREIDVLVRGHHLDRVVTPGRWTNSFSSEKGESLWGDDETTKMNTSLLPYLVDISGAVEVDVDGFPFEKCGHFFLFCSSFESGVSRMEGACLDTIKVMKKIVVSSRIEMKGSNSVVGNTSTSTLSFSKSGQFENSPKDDVNSSLSFSSLILSIDRLERTTPLFVCTSGTLSFTFCSLIGSPSDVLTFTPISITDGELLLEEVQTNGITLSSSALIVSTGKIRISKSTFTQITRETGLGCVLEGETGKDVAVLDSSFELCTSSETKTWILLKGGETSHLVEGNWKGTLSPLSFRESVMVFVPPASGSDGQSPTADPFNPHSLLYEFYRRESEVIVVSGSEVNEDHPLCGHAKLPCLTVDRGVELTGQRRVEIVGDADLRNALRMDGELLKIEGHKRKGAMKMIGKSGLVNNLFDDPDTLLLSFVTLDLSHSTLTSSDALIVNENGEVEFSSAAIASSLSVACSLVRLTGGQAIVSNLTLSDLSFSSVLFDLSMSELSSFSDVTVSSCSMSCFLKSENGSHLTLKSCAFDGSTVVSNDEPSDESQDVCEWTDSFITLTNTSTTLDSVKMSHLTTGAVWMEDGSLKVEANTFHDNLVHNSSFPSVRRNIFCSSGQLNVESLNGGDGHLPRTAGWITVGDECHFSSPILDVQSPLFIPTLITSDTQVKADKKTKNIQVEIAGKLLIPCGLSLEVFEWNDKTKRETGKWFELEISPVAQKWTETALDVTLSESEVAKWIDVDEEWRLRLMFGCGVRGGEWVRVKMSRAGEKKALAVESLKWIIPIAGGILGLLVLFLIIVVCCRKQRKKTTEEKKALLTHEELDAVDVKVCFDDVEFGNESANIMDDRTGNHNRPSTLIGTKEESMGLDKGKSVGEEKEETGFSNGVFMCEALSTGSKIDVVFVDRRQTLHDRIHNPKPNAPALDRLKIQQAIVEGLKQLDRNNQYRWLLGKVNPQRILVDSNQQVFLKVREEAAVPPDKRKWGMGVEGGWMEQSHQMMMDQQGQCEKDNLQRWVAPELGEKDLGRSEGTGAGEGMDLVKASVFSLGLVLFEIETGRVPFGEIDGINAQRQLGTGTRPNMEHMNEEMQELISECLNVTPSERPTLEEVSKKLIEIGKSTGQLTKEEAFSIAEEQRQKKLAASD
ncbi:hypothetical protein BLNAU_8123 [Blattamonas nauphoetae]|uniref:Protein kinase domain-containing protein n=1 Tax=Blattamonas nauphoetae TaxID=2049346 RepID=A0ABQ9XZE2_9EUKA|nr:hypothetical protein BLNAU_8123 [Blattamonas nauphoetae]